MATRVQSAVIVHCSVDDEEFSNGTDAFTAELEQIEAAEGIRAQHSHASTSDDDDEHDDADDSGDLCDEEEETTSTASARVVPKLSFAALTAPAADASAMRRCSMPGTSVAPLAASLATGPTASKLKLTGAAGRVAKKTAGAAKTAGTSAAKKGAAAALPAQGARPTRQQCQSVYASSSRTALHTSTSSQNLKQGSSGVKGGEQPLTARQVAKERAGIALGDLASARGKENSGSSAHGKREVVVSVSRYMNSNRNTKNTCTIEKTVQAAATAAAASSTSSSSGAMTARRSSLHDGSMSARTRSNASGTSTTQTNHASKRRSDAMDLVVHSGSNPALLAPAATSSAAAGDENGQSPCKKAKLDNAFMPACSPVMESPEVGAYASSPMDSDAAVRKLSFGAGSPVVAIAPIATAAAAESDSMAHKTLLKVAAELAEKDAALSAALARVTDLCAQLSSAEESASAARADTQSAMDIATEAQAATQLSRQRATAAQEELDALRKKFNTLKSGVSKLSEERHEWREQAQQLTKHCLANGLALPPREEWKRGDTVDFSFSTVAAAHAEGDARRATCFAASASKARR